MLKNKHVTHHIGYILGMVYIWCDIMGYRTNNIILGMSENDGFSR